MATEKLKTLKTLEMEIIISRYALLWIKNDRLGTLNAVADSLGISAEVLREKLREHGYPDLKSDPEGANP